MTEDPVELGPLMEEDSNSSSLPILKEESVIDKYCTACQLGDLITVKKLIESQIIEIGKDVDKNNVSGLHWASINNRLSVVKYLISQGVEVDKIGGELNATPLHWACRYGLVYIVDYLIQNGGADPTIVDNQGFNSLHLAINSSNIMLVIYILTHLQIDVDCPDPNDRTALHWAAYQGDYLSVETLLKFHANVKKIDNEGFTPLHWSLIRGSKDCVKLLIEEGSDIWAKTNDGKNCFDIAKDMNTQLILTQALYENGFDSFGNPIKKILTSEKGKIITFIFPYLTLGLFFKSLSHWGFIITLLISLIFNFITIKIFQKIIFPSYILTNNNPIFKSPLLAGLFSGTSFWIIFVWLNVLLPYTFTKFPLINLFFLLFTGVTLYCFQRAMFRNPGIIEPPSTNEEIKRNVRYLLERGKFDAKNFCIHTFILKPLRSKYSNFYNKCVARFDHACPWVYNDIGLRNHKVFMFFVCSLWIDIVLYFFMVREYFDIIETKKGTECSLLDEKLCSGLTNSPFIFYLTMWALFQFVWLSFLLFTQLVQISKGVTTLELSNFSKNTGNFYYSSVPSDLQGDTTTNDGSNHPIQQEKKWYSTFCVVTGLDQFLLTLRQSKKNSSLNDNGLKTDYGIKQNCIDFWFASGDQDLKLRNFWKLPVKDEANLNGQKIEYYKLFELPEKNWSNNMV